MTVVVGRNQYQRRPFTSVKRRKMDVGDAQQETMSLRIKTPNQAHEDQTVDGVCLNWTVHDLKTHLSTLYTTKPAVREQRLIYAGKLLPDHLHIRDLFRQTDCVPTLHLVCAFRNPPQGPLGARPKTRDTERPSSLRPDPSSSSSGQTPTAPRLRQRRPASSSSAAASPQTPEAPLGPAADMPGAPRMTQPAFPSSSLYSPQQLLWLQHVYARQYYMQYHAALVAAGSVPSAPAATACRYPPVPAHQVPVPDPLANQNPINNLPANQNPVQGGAFVNPGEANQNMRMNAQGGPVMAEDEDVERDWLDWLYSATRFSVLLIIVYFNSSLSRFLLVMSALLLVYLHTVGWFPFRGPDPLQPPAAQNNQQDGNRHPDAVEQDADRQGAEPAAAVGGAEQQGPMAAVLVRPHRLSVMWTLWVFLRTLLSSLVPELPQAVAN